MFIPAVDEVDSVDNRVANAESVSAGAYGALPSVAAAYAAFRRADTNQGGWDLTLGLR